MATTSRQEQKATTRAAILRIASDEFDLHGYAATSVARVAENLQMTKGSVYFHFASKALLAAEVVRVSFDVWDPLVRSVDDHALSGLDAVRRLLVDLAQRYTDDASLRAALRLMREESPVRDRLPEALGVWAGVLRRYLDQAVGAGQLRPGTDVDALARHLVALFLGLQEITQRAPTDGSLAEQVEDAWETTLVGLVRTH
ncbi:TetR family transcriptional regulator [Isoptericola jiangsuensis]|uniref:TetR family transcriptional regulator n=1 Tax=Isoptericola jiangsuensis TaxID=548579 RepID=UPI003AADFCEF